LVLHPVAIPTFKKIQPQKNAKSAKKKRHFFVLFAFFCG